ncbi:MAG TPA: hypothetical protein VHB97_07555, partial [Polyangia bacterium]|nr:hypothetical protein [Polyangia bacterium]
IVRPTHPQILDLCSQIDAIGDELSAIDLGAFTFPDGGDALSQGVSWQLSQRLNELAMKVVLVDDACAETAGWQEVGDVCFVSSAQLRGLRRRLAEHRDYEDLLVACESALRLVRRMLQAIRDAVRAASGEPRVTSAIFADEIAAALTVRRLYNELRRGFRPCAGHDRPAVSRALHDAADALATLIGAAEFPVVRAGDRLLILRLHGRVIDWARTGGSVAEGLQLLLDVETAAELLRGVNQRQELRAHDEQLAAKLAAALPPMMTTDIAAHLGDLALLDGHDVEVDRLIAAAREDRLDAEQLGRLRAALVRIARHDDGDGHRDFARTPLAK